MHSFPSKRNFEEVFELRVGRQVHKLVRDDIESRVDHESDMKDY
eukprot:gene112-16332_t